MITYSVERLITADQYIELLNSCTLGARRPVDDPARIRGMLEHANLLVTAWDGELLVGASRCLSDYSYVTYCSDLAVRESHQSQGIGRELLKRTLETGGCTIVLLSAPQAVEYYPHIGFQQHPSAWTVRPGQL